MEGIWKRRRIIHGGELYTRVTYGGTYTVQVVGEKLPVLPMGYSVSEGQVAYNEE